MDTDQPLPTLNLFCVSAVNDMTVSISVTSIIESQIWWEIPDFFKIALFWFQIDDFSHTLDIPLNEIPMSCMDP